MKKLLIFLSCLGMAWCVSCKSTGRVAFPSIDAEGGQRAEATPMERQGTPADYAAAFAAVGRGEVVKGILTL